MTFNLSVVFSLMYLRSFNCLYRFPRSVWRVIIEEHNLDKAVSIKYVNDNILTLSQGEIKSRVYANLLMSNRFSSPAITI